MIAVVDYDTGNLCSVADALGRIGSEFVVTADHNVIRAADKVLLPGVGEASSAMAKLRERGLDGVIRTLTQPVLGICIGVQLMCRYSQEGDTHCLGIFETDVKRFGCEGVMSGLKVPHMGWNTIYGLDTPLFFGIADLAYLYYVHSFAPEICRHTIASTRYGIEFSAALGHDNFYGTQFHPEKSGSVGEKVLENFLEL